jgi:hypothetical protein
VVWGKAEPRRPARDGRKRWRVHRPGRFTIPAPLEKARVLDGASAASQGAALRLRWLIRAALVTSHTSPREVLGLGSSLWLSR